MEFTKNILCYNFIKDSSDLISKNIMESTKNILCYNFIIDFSDLISKTIT